MTGRSTTGETLWQRLHAQGKTERDAYAKGDGRALPASQRYLLSSDVGIIAMIRMLATRVEELEGRLAEGGVEYAGVWAEGRQYRRGHMVTFHGSIWHANEPTTAKPGEGHGWQLAVRKGRDAKDARP